MTEEWKSLNDEEKKPYLEQTAVQKKRYETEMKAYRAKKAAEAAAQPKTPAKGKKEAAASDAADAKPGKKRTAK